MSALTEICRDLFAPRPAPKLTFAEGAKTLGCALVLVAMFVAMVAPWLFGAWAFLQWVLP